MPIYLVRWPSFKASLMRAEDEEDLLYLIDQAGNPDWCTWSLYDGPLAIDFHLPVEWSVRNERPGEPIAPDQIVIDDLGPLAGQYVIGTITADVDVEEESIHMLHKIVEQAFPNVHAAVEYLFSDEGLELYPDGVLPEARLRDALHADLRPLLGASWRRAHLHRKTDRISAVARLIDMPIALVRRLAAEIEANEVHEGRAGSTAEVTAPEQLPLRVSSLPNHVAPRRDELPRVDDASGEYVGYFVNEHGEQSVYSYDGRTGEATVRPGNAGSEIAQPIVNGEAAGVVLTEAERVWVRACWLATGASRRHP